MSSQKLVIGESRILTIKAREFWNEAKLDIAAGERYRFMAEGRWWDMIMPARAGGFSSLLMRWAEKKKRVQDQPWFALMGSINKAHHFLIGATDQSIPMQHTGALYLFANDAEGYYWNNWGKLKLRILREA